MRKVIGPSAVFLAAILAVAFQPLRVEGGGLDSDTAVAPPPVFYWVCHFPGHVGDIQMASPINADGNSACWTGIGGAIVYGTTMYLPQVPCNIHTGTVCV